jgi:predicted DsbA family dithiol-disulfide isomerase
MDMELTVLAVPACPNAALLEKRLAEAVAGLPGVRVAREVVHDERQAAALGMRGSPTLLIDGRDPFAAPGQPASLSCRLYPQPDGSIAGAPSAHALRQALAKALRNDHRT